MLLVGVSGNDPKNDFELFLRDYGWILCVAVVALIAITITALLIVNRNKKKAPKVEASPDEWLLALGGKENILDVSSTGSRLTVKLVNKELINRESLTQLGVNNIVMMSDKVTLVTQLDNNKIVENMKNLLQN